VHRFATSRRRRPDPLAATLLAVTTFFVILVVLAVQLHVGRDPGLATRQPASAITSVEAAHGDASDGAND
jgi:hypothetical protein